MLSRRNSRRRRPAVALLYMLLGFTVLCGVASLAVEYGHVRMVKSELQAAVDSAAHAAAADLTNGTTTAKNTAVSIAGNNTADGTAVTLNSATDVEFGTWDSTARTFTVLTGSAASSANSVRVTARRTSAGGNPVRLYFAALLGRSSCDVTASAIATQSASSGGYIGLSLTRMYNTAYFDAYNSASGNYSSGSSLSGNLLSYSDMWLYDTSRVKGEAHWDNSGTFNHDSTAIVSPGPASAQNLSSNFPAVNLGNVATVNDNSRLSQYYSSNQLVIGNNKGTINYPAGTYYFTKFDIGDNNTVYFAAPTTIYLKCGGQITSKLAASNLRPSGLAIKVASSYNWTIDSGGVFYGSFYNPTGDVHHHNGGISYGSVISDLLCFRQDSQGHQDLNLGKWAAAASISLVK